MKMKKITNPKWMKRLKLLHLLGTMLLCTGLLGASAAWLAPEPDQQLIAFFTLQFTRNGGILLLATGLIYNLFTGYGFKRLWIVLKWIATVLLIAVSVGLRSSALVLPIQLALLAVIMVLSVYKWQGR